MKAKLQKEFYTRNDTLKIASELLGKVLCSELNHGKTEGIICETEAYCGTEDRGCHAYKGRYTDRTSVMFQTGGVAYVYLCYGVHHLFNVVTHREGEPHAILIRAIEPIGGIDIMLRRSGKNQFDPSLAAGPGLVSKCMGFKIQQSGESLLGERIWIEDRGIQLPDDDLIRSPRVGMNFDGPYRLIPWRFRIRNSKFTSKAK